jgi:hypothetical protein
MNDKPNTRPWDDPEDKEDEYAMVFLMARYPDMEHDMALYESIMTRGAALSISIAGVLHWVCTAVVMTHIRTPRWVKRTLYYAGCFALGFTVAAGLGWLVISLIL